LVVVEYQLVKCKSEVLAEYRELPEVPGQVLHPVPVRLLVEPPQAAPGCWLVAEGRDILPVIVDPVILMPAVVVPPISIQDMAILGLNKSQ